MCSLKPSWGRGECRAARAPLVPLARVMQADPEPWPSPQRGMGGPKRCGGHTRGADTNAPQTAPPGSVKLLLIHSQVIHAQHQLPVCEAEKKQSESETVTLLRLIWIRSRKRILKVLLLYRD